MGIVRVAARAPRRAVVVATLCAVLAVALGAGAWALSGPAGARGHDISYPQCGTTYPTTGTFGVVGVNGGKVSTTNPCLAGQYAWATRSGDAQLYVNTGNPGAISTFYWPASGARDPALCTDRTSPADAGCAYDYGWHGAENSLQIARSTLGDGVLGRAWWLDVELANSWNGSTSANAASLQGALDRLRTAGIGSVGIYSTTYQWGQITGGYRAGTAATYKNAWARSFTPKVAMESVPLWIAGLGTVEAAAANCTTSFTGGPTTMAQYTDGAVDGDLLCGGATTPTTPPTSSTSTTPPTSTTSMTTTTAPPASTTTTTPAPAPTTTTTAPTTTTTTPTTTPPRTTTTTTTKPPAGPPGAPTAVVARTHPVRGIALSWTAPTVTGGSPVTRYVVLRGTAPGRETALGVLTCTTPTCTWQDAAITGGRTAYYQLVAVNTANAMGPRSLEVSARGR